MVTIPKLIDPLQIALGIGCSFGWRSARDACDVARTRDLHRNAVDAAAFPHASSAYPQVYQHKLLINKDLQRRLLIVQERAAVG
jgi:hypothetical protein